MADFCEGENTVHFNPQKHPENVCIFLWLITVQIHVGSIGKYNSCPRELHYYLSYIPIATKLKTTVSSAKRVLARVGHVQESVCIFVFRIYVRDERGVWRQDIFHKDEKCFLRTDLDASANDVRKLSHGEIVWHKVLLLVDVRWYFTLVSFLHDNLDGYNELDLKHEARSAQ